MQNAVIYIALHKLYIALCIALIHPHLSMQRCTKWVWPKFMCALCHNTTILKIKDLPWRGEFC